MGNMRQGKTYHPLEKTLRVVPTSIVYFYIAYRTYRLIQVNRKCMHVKYYLLGHHFLDMKYGGLLKDL